MAASELANIFRYGAVDSQDVPGSPKYDRFAPIADIGHGFGVLLG